MDDLDALTACHKEGIRLAIPRTGAFGAQNAVNLDIGVQQTGAIAIAG
jgi:hypothetical protein